MTEAERVLWKVLRGKRLGGLKFRRQEPIGPFIVDFVCFEKKLILEADGSQHYEGRQKQIDIDRDAWLREQGFEILRFSNQDILTNVNGIVMEMLKHTAMPVHPPDGSSPSMGEDQGGGVLDK